MSWLVGYPLIALLAAFGAFAWGGWLRPLDAPSPLRPGWTALLTGAMWPVLLVAFMQLLVLIVIARLMVASGRHAAGPSAPAHRSPTPIR